MNKQQSSLEVTKAQIRTSVSLGHRINIMLVIFEAGRKLVTPVTFIKSTSIKAIGQKGH